MAHPKDNGIIYFDIHKSEPIDKRKKPTFQLVVRYHTFWLFESFFKTEEDANDFIEKYYKFFCDLCEEEERRLSAHQQIWAKETKERLKFIWR